jgi:hypothetical protein
MSIAAQRPAHVHLDLHYRFIVFNQRLTSQKLYGPVGFLPQLPLMRMPAPPLTPILAA